MMKLKLEKFQVSRLNEAGKIRGGVQHQTNTFTVKTYPIDDTPGNTASEEQKDISCINGSRNISTPDGPSGNG